MLDPVKNDNKIDRAKIVIDFGLNYVITYSYMNNSIKVETKIVVEILNYRIELTQEEATLLYKNLGKSLNVDDKTYPFTSPYAPMPSNPVNPNPLFDRWYCKNPENLC